MSIKIKPLHDNLLVEPLPEETVSEKGIIISTSKDSENSVKGKIIAVGDGYKVGSEKQIKFLVSIGDIVVFKEYSGTSVEMGNVKYKLIPYEDVIAVLE